jgi:hypothetical protein
MPPEYVHPSAHYLSVAGFKSYETLLGDKQGARNYIQERLSAKI